MQPINLHFPPQADLWLSQTHVKNVSSIYIIHCCRLVPHEIQQSQKNVIFSIEFVLYALHMLKMAFIRRGIEETYIDIGCSKRGECRRHPFFPHLHLNSSKPRASTIAADDSSTSSLEICIVVCQGGNWTLDYSSSSREQQAKSEKHAAIRIFNFLPRIRSLLFLRRRAFSSL